MPKFLAFVYLGATIFLGVVSVKKCGHKQNKKFCYPSLGPLLISVET